MCGRYSLTTPLAALRALFGFEEQPNLQPRYNIAPTQEVPVVREEDGKRHLRSVRWGLIPGWAKDRTIAAKLINARSESAHEKPSFRQAFAKRPCLIPADGFYEWKAEKDGKQPYRIAFGENRPFAFAGLWESWRDPAGGAKVETCTILTTDANDSLRWLHDRMPVILAPDDFDLWLSPASTKERRQALLIPYKESTAYGPLLVQPVSKAVNKVANDGPDLIKPLKNKETLF